MKFDHFDLVQFGNLRNRITKILADVINYTRVPQTNLSPDPLEYSKHFGGPRNKNNLTFQ